MVQAMECFRARPINGLQFFVSKSIQTAPDKEFIMTTINTGSLTAYSSGFSVGFKNDDSTKSEAVTASANLSTAVPPQKPSTVGTTTREQMIKQLQQQIKEVQKQLQEQQKQLAAVQHSKMPDMEKAQQVNAISQQIATTTSQMMALQASLLELMKGSVNTTA
jgi:Tfp pilus assembly protein FimV